MFGPEVKDGMVTMVDSPGLVALCRDAENRDSNRQANTELVASAIDPDGTHILSFKMMHNGHEWRTKWLCKAKGSDTPQELWLDVSLTAFDCATRQEAISPEMLLESRRVLDHLSVLDRLGATPGGVDEPGDR